MIRLWEFLIHGCWHQWSERDARDLFSNGRGIVYGTRYTYLCEKCLRVKKKDVT